MFFQISSTLYFFSRISFGVDIIMLSVTDVTNSGVFGKRSCTKLQKRDNFEKFEKDPKIQV